MTRLGEGLHPGQELLGSFCADAADVHLNGRADRHSSWGGGCLPGLADHPVQAPHNQLSLSKHEPSASMRSAALVEGLVMDLRAGQQRHETLQMAVKAARRGCRPLRIQSCRSRLCRLCSQTEGPQWWRLQPSPLCRAALLQNRVQTRLERHAPFVGATGVLQRKDAGVVCWQPLLGIPRGGAPAFQSPVACKALPCRHVRRRVNLHTGPVGRRETCSASGLRLLLQPW